MPRRKMRVIARRTIMLAIDRSWDQAETNPRHDQSCEHCRKSRNFPNSVHWHVFYFMCLRRVNLFFATGKSSAMLCTELQRNEMQKLNCECAYSPTGEHNLLLTLLLTLLTLLLLRTALAPYWQSLVHLNCACSITTRYYYTKSSNKNHEK